MKTILFLSLFSTFLLSSEISSMEDACDRKVASTCYELGTIYEQSPKYFQKSKAFYTKACDYGFDKACSHLEELETKAEKTN